MRQIVELEKAYRLLNHGPTVLISSACAGKENVMAAAWTMPLDFSPPKVAIVVDRNTYTRQLIEASGEFVINIPPVAMAQLTVAVGDCSGRECDKFSHFHLGKLDASQLQVPLVDGCIGWLECRLLREPHTQQTYDLLLGEVVAAWADDRVFSHGHWHFPSDDLRTIHHVAGGHFFQIGDEVSTEHTAD
ncbi:flavin reductase family protein [Tolumonas lignilytica]|uniref:flavin reductase family protein n=1 Tax=Tolumonas lignilytica TaxID=1283284 RepID=UPI0004631EDE|nr:flavin reductase family protein [Tolumonas lignilytica]